MSATEQPTSPTHTRSYTAMDLTADAAASMMRLTRDNATNLKEFLDLEESEVQLLEPMQTMVRVCVLCLFCVFCCGCFCCAGCVGCVGIGI